MGVLLRRENRTREMARGLRVHVTFPNDPSWVPNTSIRQFTRPVTLALWGSDVALNSAGLFSLSLSLSYIHIHTENK